MTTSVAHGLHIPILNSFCVYSSCLFDHFVCLSLANLETTFVAITNHHFAKKIRQKSRKCALGT